MHTDEFINIPIHHETDASSAKQYEIDWWKWKDIQERERGEGDLWAIRSLCLIYTLKGQIPLLGNILHKGLDCKKRNDEMYYTVVMSIFWMHAEIRLNSAFTTERRGKRMYNLISDESTFPCQVRLITLFLKNSNYHITVLSLLDFKIRYEMPKKRGITFSKVRILLSRLKALRAKIV